MEQTIIEATTMEVQLKEVFEQHCTRQVLFVLGASFRKQKLYGRLQELMKNAGVGCTEFSDFQPNPKYESVVAGIEALRAHHCDFIIAAGGGSAMDVAKCIKLFSEMDLSKNCLEQEIVENALPLLAIPTTAGTGSEATRFAVIYYQGNKQSVAHPSCVPGWVLMEPELLESLPMYQRKATMLDAFCHAAESFWSVNSTEDSRENAAEAIRLVLKYAGSYLANEKDGNAQMLRAANIAGKAINVTQTTAGHAMAYKITTLYGLSHGHAVALIVDSLWPYMAAHTENCIDPRGEAYLKTMFEELAKVCGCDSVEASIEKYQNWFAALDLERPTLQNAGQLDLLTHSVNPVRLKNNPVQLTEETLESLYRQILQQML